MQGEFDGILELDGRHSISAGTLVNSFHSYLRRPLTSHLNTYKMAVPKRVVRPICRIFRNSEGAEIDASA